MTGRCTGGYHHAPTSGGACPCGAVSRHPVAVPVRAGDEEIVAALAEALNGTAHLGCEEFDPNDPDSGCPDCDDLLRAVAKLLPTVRRVAEQRAAEELTAVADEMAPGLGDTAPPKHYWPLADWIRTRAAALTATPNHGTDVTT